jgi:hypothetical protein
MRQERVLLNEVSRPALSVTHQRVSQGPLIHNFRVTLGIPAEDHGFPYGPVIGIGDPPFQAFGDGDILQFFTEGDDLLEVSHEIH